jgi:hypothetical protein
MTTINLYQDQQEQKHKEEVGKKTSKFKVSGSLMLLLGIIALTLLTFSGVRGFLAYLENKDGSLKDQIAEREKSFIGGSEFERAFDMQIRLRNIKNNLNIKEKEVKRQGMNKVLKNLEDDFIVSGVLLSDYNYTDGKVKVVFDADNFNSASRQIISLKNSENFLNANLVQIGINEQGVIKCTVEMNAKNPL